MTKLLSHIVMLYATPSTVGYLTEHALVGLAQYSDHIIALIIALLLMPFVRPLFE